MSNEQYLFLFNIAKKYFFKPDARECDRELARIYDEIKKKSTNKSITKQALITIIVLINIVSALECKGEKL